MSNQGLDVIVVDSYSHKLLNRFEVMYREQNFCDLVLSALGENTGMITAPLEAGESTDRNFKEIHCHKLVLIAASDYFSAMFASQMVEARESRVCLHDIPFSSLQILVDFAYTGEIDVTRVNVHDVLLHASILQFTDVVSQCIAHLEKHLGLDNTFQTLTFSWMNDLSKLWDISLSFTLSNFVALLSENATDFEELPFEVLRQLFDSDLLNVHKEEEVYQAMLRWLNYQSELRSDFLPELFRLIRVPFLPVEFLADIQETPLLRESESCQAVIMEGMKFHLVPERRSSLCTSRAIPRKSTIGLLYVLGGIDRTLSGGNACIEKFSPRDCAWLPCANLTTNREQFGTGRMNSVLYLVGGRDGLRTLNTMQCFDPKNNSWRTSVNMETHRHGLAVCVVESTLYAIGGHDGWSFLNTVERYDPQLEVWSCVPSMKAARCNAQAASVNSKIYVVGGRDGSSCLKTVETYDPHTNRWQYCGSMNKRRAGHGIAIFQGCIYVAGGHDAIAQTINPVTVSPRESQLFLDSVERYDPSEDMWTVVRNMSVPRDYVALGVLGNLIYAVGGYDGLMKLSSVEQYDPLNDSWSQVTNVLISIDSPEIFLHYKGFLGSINGQRTSQLLPSDDC